MGTERGIGVLQSISKPFAPAMGRSETTGRNRSILCIDSYKPVLATLRSVLTKAGYNVFIATTLAEALSICSEHHVDLAIFDCGLQCGDRLCIAQHIRKFHPDAQMVAWSAGGRPDKRPRPCPHVNFMKPLRADEMLERLDSLFQHRDI